MLAPILLLILLGILEVGRLVDAWIVVENAAREGARAGAMATTADPTQTAQSVTQTYLQNGLAGRTDLTIPPQPTVSVASDSVQVMAEADVVVYMPLVQNILHTPKIPVRATALMRRQ
jgi:Flp pilus assembly protein TadG